MNEFIVKLKAATLPVHKQLEETGLSKMIMSPAVTAAQYALYLASLYNMHREVENRVFDIVKKVIPDTDLRKKTTKIKEDLAALGQERLIEEKPFLDAHYKTNLNFNVGLMYVTEGSVLGGQYILKNIRKVIGETTAGNFLNVYGKNTGLLWQSFLTSLDKHQQHLNDGEKEEIIEGAKYGFERAKSIFT